MLTRTSTPLDQHVKAFCRQIAPSSTPTLLPILPDPDAQPLDCFHNVRTKVAREGGRIVYGWAIWEWPQVYIEAEHHAVFEAADGKTWIDPTPSEHSHIETRLFIEDQSAPYDFENEGVRRDNHRLAQKQDRLIQEFFQNARAVSEAMNALPGVGEIRVSPEVARRIEALRQRNAALTYRLAMKYLSRNDRCFCGSGKKFKFCHGQGR